MLSDEVCVQKKSLEKYGQPRRIGQLRISTKKHILEARESAAKDQQRKVANHSRPGHCRVYTAASWRYTRWKIQSSTLAGTFTLLRLRLFSLARSTQRSSQVFSLPARGRVKMPAMPSVLGDPPFLFLALRRRYAYYFSLSLSLTSDMSTEHGQPEQNLSSRPRNYLRPNSDDTRDALHISRK
ncbi:unnamed protein product [Trichogramma brassicae]|uniref:Uncharacterized protein n=1 Tax=Trichogramma brassicae TaxID=86971 RepID=A0A6H5I3I9_9HYME|nr:unnamed protein product [Trichogramma brassicae]